mmetsp:Transcript_27543/g.68023  ORF Transcript_27543/g.68023 Transcript_27543/m.68023 type:complete len:388 (-) Transcript_27543:224-1387(-)
MLVIPHGRPANQGLVEGRHALRSAHAHNDVCGRCHVLGPLAAVPRGPGHQGVPRGADVEHSLVVVRVPAQVQVDPIFIKELLEPHPAVLGWTAPVSISQQCRVIIAIGVPTAVEGPVPEHNNPRGLRPVGVCRLQVRLKPLVLPLDHARVKEVDLRRDHDVVHQANVEGVKPVVWCRAPLRSTKHTTVAGHVAEALREVIESIPSLVIPVQHHVGHPRRDGLHLAHPLVARFAVVVVEIVSEISCMQEHVDGLILRLPPQAMHSLHVRQAQVSKDRHADVLRVPPFQILELEDVGPAQVVAADLVVVERVGPQPLHVRNVHHVLALLIPLVLKLVLGARRLVLERLRFTVLDRRGGIVLFLERHPRDAHGPRSLAHGNVNLLWLVSL